MGKGPESVFYREVVPFSEGPLSEGPLYDIMTMKLTLPQGTLHSLFRRILLGSASRPHPQPRPYLQPHPLPRTSNSRIDI